MSQRDIEKLIRDRKLHGLKYPTERHKSEKPENLNQLFLEDIKKIPLGVDLTVMVSGTCSLGSYHPLKSGLNKKTGQIFAFTGIEEGSGVWYFKNPKAPYGRELYAYGCIIGPSNKWQKDIWLVFTDENLREWYEKNRRD
jgi:hypothetical protein